MIKYKKGPEAIHTAYNPVIFQFQAIDEGTVKLIFVPLINKNNEETEDIGRQTTLEIEFSKTETTTTVDARAPLQALFNRGITEPEKIIVDNFVSVKYRLYKNEVSEKNFVSEHTVVKAVSQIQEAHTLPSGRLLTGFNQLLVYEGYPRDVSVLSDDDSLWKGIAQVPNMINRLAINCDDNNMEAPNFRDKCVAEWTGFTCQKEDSENIVTAEWSNYICQEEIETKYTIEWDDYICQEEVGSITDERKPTILSIAIPQETVIDFEAKFITNNKITIDFGNGNTFKGYTEDMLWQVYPQGEYEIKIWVDEIKLKLDEPYLTKVELNNETIYHIDFQNCNMENVICDDPNVQYYL